MSSVKIEWLFESKALRIAPAERPFLYTSGLIGPYYVNTHYLCGGENEAERILSFIDQHQEQRIDFPKKICAELDFVYAEHTIYREVIAGFCACIEAQVPLAQIDYVSGGQRRDWFFAPLVARELRKPCLYIYGDLEIRDAAGAAVSALSGVRVINVADLLTVASSYTTKWIPALRKVGAELLWSVNGVDRNQGGRENLLQGGLRDCFSLFSIDLKLFETAHKRGLIDQAQFSLVREYLNDPFTSMRNFLVAHPQYLDGLKAAQDEKTQARVRLLVGDDLYKLRV